MIETATQACSVALYADGVLVAACHDVVGRGHAERLVPMIAALPDGGRAERIAVDVGPGSFTGVRVGIAAARGLRLGWGAELSGFSSLALVAAAALRDDPVPVVAAVLEAGHGEVFVQRFDAALVPLDPLRSLAPADAAALIGTAPAVGNGVHRLAGLLDDRRERLPNAADWPLLPRALADLEARPLYGRAPDAKLPG